jgi:hypothetical protein
VGAFLAAVTICVLGPFNLWPFSSWELFSHLRSDRQTGWDAVAVEPNGQDRAFPSTLSRRDLSCAAWVRDADKLFGTSTRLVRVYRVRWTISDRRGDRGPPRHRTLAQVCREMGV